jgi:hypothetical protein
MLLALLTPPKTHKLKPIQSSHNNTTNSFTNKGVLVTATLKITTFNIYKQWNLNNFTEEEAFKAQAITSKMILR